MEAQARRIWEGDRSLVWAVVRFQHRLDLAELEALAEERPE